MTRPANDNPPCHHDQSREIAMVAIDFERQTATAIRKDGKRFVDLLPEMFIG